MNSMNKRGKGVFFAFVAVAMVLCFAASVMAAQLGPLKIGGAIRANYVYGDYEKSGSDGPERGDNGGNFELDTFRINLDFAKDRWLGKAEYRWYNGYNFLHTGWLGYDFGDAGQVQVGLNRVPFGVGPYGPSNNWFFDQHYYVGLSDDMDYGVKYSRTFGRLGLDLAYYLMAEHSFLGDSDESARYSYDIVDEGTPYSHYEEMHQANLRCIYSLEDIAVPTDLGFSLQWGQLDADSDFADDSDAYAASIHSKSTLGPWGLVLQLTQYQYDADYKGTATDANGMRLTDDLIVMGAYDFAWPVASEGTIPSVALTYTWKPHVDWVDSITFYNDYSVILKDGETAAGEDFNDSAMNVLGMAVAKGGWYIYVDYAYSNGNYFVGNEGDVYNASFDGVGDFGINGNDDWNGRFNINFGYYF
jgi:hypothetical protein